MLNARGYARVQAWHVETLNADPKGRTSVVLRTFLAIAVAVSGRKGPWWIEGGIRRIAAEIRADVKDVRAAVHHLDALGIIERVERRTRGRSGDYLASAYVLRRLPPVDNPASGGGGLAPLPVGGGLPPSRWGADCPPPQEDVGADEEDDPTSRPLPCGEGHALGLPISDDTGTADGIWLSEEEHARILLAVERLHVLVPSSARLHDVARYVEERASSAARISGPRGLLCPSCGWGMTWERDKPAPRAGCGACGARVRVARRSDVVDDRGAFLGAFLRPAVVLSRRGGLRGEADTIDRAAIRVGLWTPDDLLSHP